MSRIFKCKPSEFIKIKDDYTAFCFDECCAYMLSEIESGLKPNFALKNKTYNSFKDFYKDL